MQGNGGADPAQRRSLGIRPAERDLQRHASASATPTSSIARTGSPSRASVAINNFVPTDAPPSSRARRSTVPVTDGRLTVAATGGTNTKINYVDIAVADPNATPTATATRDGDRDRDAATATATPPGPTRAAGQALSLEQHDRQEVSYAEAGGKFYLAGGQPSAAAGPRCTRSTTRRPNTWTRVARPPARPRPCPGRHLNGLIYYIGGLAGFPGPSIDDVYIYNPATNTFAPGAPMPAGRDRGAGGVAVYEGKIYYYGGVHTFPDGTRAVNWFDVYDPVTNTWTQLPDMPTVRDHSHAAIVGGTLYAIGGRDFVQHRHRSPLSTPTTSPRAPGGADSPRCRRPGVDSPRPSSAARSSSSAARSAARRLQHGRGLQPVDRHLADADADAHRRATASRPSSATAASTSPPAVGSQGVARRSPSTRSSSPAAPTVLAAAGTRPRPRRRPRRDTGRGGATDHHRLEHGGAGATAVGAREVRVRWSTASSTSSAATPTAASSRRRPRVDVYDTATNTWTRLNDSPTMMTHAGVAVAGRDIYMAGCVCGDARRQDQRLD